MADPSTRSVSASSFMTFSVDLGDGSIDPSVVRRKEKKILLFNDKITEISRYNSIGQAELLIQQHLNEFQARLLESRSSEVQYRKENLELLSKQYDEAVTERDNVIAKKKNLITQINRIQQSIKQTFERLERHIKKFDDDIDDDLSDESPEIAEKLAIIQNIRKIRKNNIKLQYEKGKSDLSKTLLSVQQCEVITKIHTLNDTSDFLRQKFVDFDKRAEIAQSKMTTLDDDSQLKLFQNAATEAEQLVDETERSLNRSILETMSLEAQQDYLSYKSLVKTNKERKARLKLRRAKLDRATKRREIRIKHGLIKSNPSTPVSGKQNRLRLIEKNKRNRSVPVNKQSVSFDRTSASSKRSRRSRSERRQIRIDVENDKLDHLEVENEDSRLRSEELYKNKINRINELNQIISESSILKDQYNEALMRNELERKTIIDLRNQIAQRKEQIETLFKECQTISRDRTNLELNDKMHHRKLEQEKKQREIEDKRKKLDEFRKKVDYLEQQWQTKFEEVESMDEKIKKIGNQIEQNIQDIVGEVNHMMYGFSVKW